MRSPRPPPDDADWQGAEAERLRWRRDLLGQPAAAPRAGLALSGGGIRSATISLGVLQALARRGRLESFDYLSTVSGGGYTGSFMGSLFTPKSVRDGATARPSDDDMMSARDEALQLLSDNYYPLANLTVYVLDTTLALTAPLLQLFFNFLAS